MSEFKDKPAQPALRTHPERNSQECGNGGGVREVISWVPETHQLRVTGPGLGSLPPPVSFFR